MCNYIFAVSKEIGCKPTWIERDLVLSSRPSSDDASCCKSLVDWDASLRKDSDFLWQCNSDLLWTEEVFDSIFWGLILLKPRGHLSLTSRFPGFPRHPSSWQTKRSSFLITRSNTRILPSAEAVFIATSWGVKACWLSASGCPCM